MQAKRFILGVVALAVGACVSEPDVEVGVEVAYNTGGGGSDQCPLNSCGDPNSPVVDGVYFWRLHLGPVFEENPEGVRILGVHKDNQLLRLELVQGDRLRAIDGANNILEHAALEGTKIRVSATVKGVLKVYDIIISRVALGTTGGGTPPEETFWVAPAVGIEAYDFVYTPITDLDPDKRIPLCSNRDGISNQLRAVVFGGDLYDPATKAITVGASTAGWFNIACVDSAIYKMHKIGHTSAAQGRLGIGTKIEQRRAMLNAWTANVCGTGQSFTQPGELITLRESKNLLPPGNGYLDPLDPAKTQTIEAIWDEHGAVCLNTARLEEDDAQIYDKIRTACGGVLPERCGSKILDWSLYGHVLVGNPPPPPVLPPPPPPKTP